MNLCKNCGNPLNEAVYNGENVLICKRCGKMYRFNSDIIMSKCEFCNIWRSKDNDKLCKCRLLNG